MYASGNPNVWILCGIAYNAGSINSAVSAVSGIQYNASIINSLVCDSISGLSSGITVAVLNLLSGLTVLASQLNMGLYVATAGKKQAYGYYIAGPVSTPFTVAAIFLGLNTLSSVVVSPRVVSGLTTATKYSIAAQLDSGATSVILYCYNISGIAVTADQNLYADVWGIGT